MASPAEVEAVFLNQHGSGSKRAVCRTRRAPKFRELGAVSVVVAHDDVDHTADGIRAVQCRTLGAANHLDALDGVGAQLG